MRTAAGESVIKCITRTTHSDALIVRGTGYDVDLAPAEGGREVVEAEREARVDGVVGVHRLLDAVPLHDSTFSRAVWRLLVVLKVS